MSAQDLVAGAQKWSKEQPWRLYGSQVSVLVRNEVHRNLFTRRRIWIYLLALLPVLMILASLQEKGQVPGVGDAEVLRLLGPTPCSGADVFERRPLARSGVERDRTVADQALADPVGPAS